MAVFKRKRGGDKTDSVWTVQVVDHRRTRQRIPDFTSKAASMELERNIRKLISIRQAGGTLDAESNRFLESASVGVRERLVAWGVIEEARAAAGKALTAHIADWQLELAATRLATSKILPRRLRWPPATAAGTFYPTFAYPTRRAGWSNSAETT